jgi:hypothetical protein
MRWLSTVEREGFGSKCSPLSSLSVEIEINARFESAARASFPIVSRSGSGQTRDRIPAGISRHWAARVNRSPEGQESAVHDGNRPQRAKFYLFDKFKSALVIRTTACSSSPLVASLRGSVANSRCTNSCTTVTSISFNISGVDRV